jgi:hypothetical protein
MISDAHVHGDWRMRYERFSGCRRLCCGRCGYTTEEYITDPTEASELSTHLPIVGSRARG